MDDFEGEVGWTDISAPPVEQAAPAASPSGGIATNSPSYLDMSGSITPEPAEQEEAKPAPQQRQAAPPQPPAPAIDYKQMAAEMYQAQLLANQHSAQANQPTAYERHLQNLLENGAVPAAVQSVDKLVDLKLQQRAEMERQRQLELEQASHYRAVDQTFNDALDKVVEAIPQLGELQASLHQKAYQVWTTDPEFAEHRQRAFNGYAVPKRIADKVAAKASDAISAIAGISKPEPPVSLKSSRPSRGTTGSVNTTGGVNGLDMAGRKYYDAVKELGHDRAMRSAKSIRSS